MLVCHPYGKKTNWLKGTKINKEIYNFHMSSKDLRAIPYRIHSKWENLFDVPIPWNQVFNLIYKTTLDSYSRYFQFKLIYNYLATKKMLNVWGIEQTNLCRFCEEEIESSPHLFWYCSTVALFWSNVQKLFSDNNKTLTLDIFRIIMGDLEGENRTINNKVILFGKIFIFKTQTIESLNIRRFKALLKHNFILETQIAEKNGNMQEHLQAWDASSTEMVLSMLA